MCRRRPRRRLFPGNGRGNPGAQGGRRGRGGRRHARHALPRVRVQGPVPTFCVQRHVMPRARRQPGLGEGGNLVGPTSERRTSVARGRGTGSARTVEAAARTGAMSALSKERESGATEEKRREASMRRCKDRCRGRPPIIPSSSRRVVARGVVRLIASWRWPRPIAVGERTAAPRRAAPSAPPPCAPGRRRLAVLRIAAAVTFLVNYCAM